MARAPSRRHPTLDRFDRAILRIVQHDAKTPQRAIAERVNLSTAAVQRRIAAMEDAGVIRANVAVIDPASLGLTVTAIVEVHLNDERAATVARAKSVFTKAPEVQHCYYVTGGVSFMLVIVAPDMPTYEATTRRLFSDNEAVATFRSLIALERVKVSSELVVAES